MSGSQRIQLMFAIFLAMIGYSCVHTLFGWDGVIAVFCIHWSQNLSRRSFQ